MLVIMAKHFMYDTVFCYTNSWLFECSSDINNGPVPNPIRHPKGRESAPIDIAKDL